jgi:hypothetical protein
VRKLYNEFFYIPKYGKGKIRDKVMLAHTAVTVVVMVVCLAAMGFTAYAYFAYNVTSASNVIRATNFETKVSIRLSEPETETIPVEQLNSVTQTATLHAGKSYLVTIEKAGTAQTGFCMITAEGCDVEKYHTQQIGKDVKSNTEGKSSITFTMSVTDTTVVTFSSHWGTSTFYADYADKGENDELYIIDGESVTLQINGVTVPAGDEEKKDEATTPSETTPAAQETTPSATTPAAQATTPPAPTEPTTPPPTTEPATEETSAPTETTSTEPAETTV